jgi:replicative DNA helicase
MEMSAEQLSFRMLSSIGRIPQTRLRNGKLHDEDWPRVDSAVSMMSEAPIFIDDSGALTPTEVRARARRLKREHGLGLIVVDYLQLMQVSGTVENRATEISEISRSLKALAKELAVPVILLSQLNREGAERPQLKHLRDSGAIEQDADVVIFLHRPDETNRELIELIIGKQRNGPIDHAYLHAAMDKMRFAVTDERPVERVQARGFGRNRSAA